MNQRIIHKLTLLCSGLILIVSAIFLTVLPPTVSAKAKDPFALYLKGTKPYGCFEGKMHKDCGPRPQALSTAGRCALHSLDYATRSINDRSLKDKALLVLSPLFAQIPVTQALATAQVNRLKRDLMKSFIVAYYREAKHLPVNIRIKRQNAMIKFLDDYKNPKQALKKFQDAVKDLQALKDSFSSYADVTPENLKKAHKNYKDFLAAKNKAIDAVESWTTFVTKMSTSIVYAQASNHFTQAGYLLDACKFDEADKRLKLAEQKLREFCRVASHEYRYAEMYTDCYGEWYIDFMRGWNTAFDQNPQQTKLKNLYRDLHNFRGSLLNMLKLFQKIDERKKHISKSRQAWKKALKVRDQLVPQFNQAIERGDYRTACNVAYRVLGTSKSLPPNLECAGQYDDLANRLITRLNRAINDKKNEISSLLNQANSRIAACELKEAQETLRKAQNLNTSLWLFRDGACRPPQNQAKITKQVAALEQKLQQARLNECSPKASGLGTQWSCNELGFTSTCTRQGRSGAFLCKWAGGCSDSLFRVSWSQGSEEIYMTRTDLTCEFSKGLTAEYRGKIKGGIIKGQRRIIGAGQGRVRPTGLLNVWQDFSCTVQGQSRGSTTGTKDITTDSQGAQKKPSTGAKLSCEQCVRKYCPQCGDLLFCQTNDPACADCMAKNNSKIEACQQ